MTPDPTDDRRPEMERATLGYARYVGEYPTPRRHRRLVVLLLLATALAGIWSIILGTVTLGDAWVFGLLLIAGGTCLCWATIGKLAAASTQLKAAIVLLLAGMAMYFPVAVMAHLLYVRQRTLHAAELQARQSDFRHMPTEAEHEVFTYAMFRDNALAAMALGTACSAYAAARLVVRRGTDLRG
jgi:hypothetical protein